MIDAERLARGEYIVRWGEWPPRDGMDSPMLAVARRHVEQVLAALEPDQHPKDPPTHPDDDRMRDEVRD